MVLKNIPEYDSCQPREDVRVQTVAIITKKHKAEVLETGRLLQHWLASRGVAAQVLENEPEPQALPLPPKLDLIIVMGGDGTLLGVARRCGKLGVPILGVNMGGLGFLTEISLDELYPCLEQVLAGRYEVEHRMMLQAMLRRQGEVFWQEDVFNDAVINKGALARIVELTTWIDGEYLTSYRADGLIISTPTGSTAYTMSAGGPIVYPTLRQIILLPICPFTLSNRPIILPDSVCVAVTLDEKVQDAYLSIDGQVGQALTAQDRVELRAAPHNLKLIKSPQRSYFEILRTKLGWGKIGGHSSHEG
jgi:NAD+ kinase